MIGSEVCEAFHINTLYLSYDGKGLKDLIEVLRALPNFFSHIHFMWMKNEHVVDHSLFPILVEELGAKCSTSHLVVGGSGKVFNYDDATAQSHDAAVVAARAALRLLLLSDMRLSSGITEFSRLSMRGEHVSGESRSEYIAIMQHWLGGAIFYDDDERATRVQGDCQILDGTLRTGCLCAFDSIKLFCYRLLLRLDQFVSLQAASAPSSGSTRLAKTRLRPLRTHARATYVRT